MATWKEIEASDKYKQLNGEEQSLLKQRYYDKVIAASDKFKGLSQDEQLELRNRFFGTAAESPSVTQQLAGAFGLSDDFLSRLGPQPKKADPKTASVSQLADIFGEVRFGRTIKAIGSSLVPISPIEEAIKESAPFVEKAAQSALEVSAPTAADPLGAAAQAVRSTLAAPALPLKPLTQKGGPFAPETLVPFASPSPADVLLGGTGAAIRAIKRVGLGAPYATKLFSYLGELAGVSKESLSAAAAASDEATKARILADKNKVFDPTIASAVTEAAESQKIAAEAAAARQRVSGAVDVKMFDAAMQQRIIDEALERAVALGFDKNHSEKVAKDVISRLGSAININRALDQAVVIKDQAYRELATAQRALRAHIKASIAETAEGTIDIAAKYKSEAAERAILERAVEKAKIKAHNMNVWSKELRDAANKKAGSVNIATHDSADHVSAARSSSPAEQEAARRLDPGGELLRDLEQIMIQMRDAEAAKVQAASAVSAEQAALVSKVASTPARPLVDLARNNSAYNLDGSLRPDVAPTPRDMSQLPKAALPSLTPEQVAKASEIVNPLRMTDASAEEMIYIISQSPEAVKQINAQKRFVVPLAESKAAGQRLGVTDKDLANLQPGQTLGRGTLDAQSAAAAAVQGLALADTHRLARKFVGGTPIGEIAQELALHKERFIKSTALISEHGRALGAVRLTAKEREWRNAMRIAFKESLLEEPAKLEKFMTEFANLPSDAMAQQALAMKRFVGDIDYRWLRAFQELRAASLLTHPATFARNALGNQLAGMTNLYERTTAGGINFLTSKLTGQPQQIALGEGLANAYGMWNGTNRAFVDALEVLKNEHSLKGFASEFASQPRAIPGPIGTVARIPFRILSAQDTFSKSVIANAELHRLAYRQASIAEGLSGAERAKRVKFLAENPTPEMAQTAFNTALEYTYNSKLDGALGHLQRAINAPGGAVLKFQVPFFRTPVNIARFTIERTPLLSELTKRGMLREAALNGINSKEFAEAVSRNITGVTALGSAYFAKQYFQGNMTGAAPANLAERENFHATGKEAYAIKVGGLWIPYRGFEPAASYLSSIADYATEYEKNPDADWTERGTQIVSNAIKNYINQPFLTGISDMVKALEEPTGGKMQALAKSAVGSMVPTGIAGIARGTRKTVPDPETPWEAFLARVPILNHRVRDKMSRFGEPIARTSFFFGLAHRPLDKQDPVEFMLRDLGIPGAVGFPSNRVNGRALTKDEYNEMLTRAGGGIYDNIRKQMSSPFFSAAPKEARIEAITSIVRDFRRDASMIVGAKAEMRALGINERLDDNELRALSSKITETIDYKFARDSQKRAVIADFVNELKRSR